MFNRRLRSAFLEFLRSIRWTSPVAVTLTLKQMADGKPIDDASASRTFRQFLNRLNRALFGSAARRFRKSVTVVPVLEHGPDTRFHFHAAIDRPEHLTDAQFELLVTDAWTKTEFGYRRIDVRPIRDDGWNLYLAKFDQKQDYALSIDWNNVHR
jgi:hypothetical protein